MIRREYRLAVGITVTLVLAAAMVVGGLQVAGMGHESWTGCGTVYVHDYDTVDESTAETLVVVAYENLTVEEQQAFRQLVETGEGGAWPNGTPPIVKYQDDYYSLSGVTSDCNPIHAAMLAGGLVFTAVGLLAWLVVIWQVRKGWRAA